MALKQSIKQYRNKNGVRFEHYASDPSEFKELRYKLKNLGFRSIICDGQLYKQVKKDSNGKSI